MPNWCENELTITGSMEEVKRFLERARSEEEALDFDHFIPYPQEFKDLDEIAEKWREEHPDGSLADEPKDGFNSGGYEWCWKNWGTKWSACDARVERHDEEGAMIEFRTAWTPPIPVVKKMAEEFPSLCFVLDYWERGAGFQGSIEIKGDEVTVEESGPYSGPRGG